MGYNDVFEVQTIFLRNLKMVWIRVWKFFGILLGIGGVSVCLGTIVQNQDMRKLRVT